MNNEHANHSVVIVGYGGMGSYHAKLIKDNGRLKVTGTYDIDGQRAAASEKDGYPAYSSYEAVLRDPAVETILIATPNDVHKDLAVQAFAAGKHVICEKPVTMSVEDFKEMTAAAERADRVLMVHQNRRWDEDFLIIKQMYEQKTVGDLFRIESRVHGANGIPGDWRHLEAYGGGMLLDWGVHLLDQLVFMVDSKITSVTGRLSFILGDEVDDGFEAVLQFENGLSALVEVGTTNFIPLPRWYVKGTEGTGVIEDWSMTGRIVTRNREAEHVEPKPIQAGVGLTKTMAPPSESATLTGVLPEPFRQPSSFYDNYVSVLEGTAEPLVKNDQVLRVLNLIEAVFRSGRTGETVKDFDLY
ncbi:Gfo/Idh/MocA family oxidoreductase [Paenibacillus sp. alder61]|uniref:Gfo/Idh/MocA family oxidoreductase n=1 Tax=Paenibacillus faecis TaxID=862114 RepID=A0A5D0CSV1_9BACL|nr:MULTISPECIES: Gfo/Idh/MocA family oxidoreductase [Paenibacillus]MCA1293626.1 Gfo/Idh/MocA family oxidoreductase [Paenibacillus sp. alder61]TYA12740.1 Gfo/Idh/MocA family oxidoreductase [Paenibacillus faecis]